MSLEKYLQFKVKDNSILVPAQIESKEFLETLKNNETVYLTFNKPRDNGFHSCYFSLLKYIYLNLPIHFRIKFIEKYPTKEYKQLELFRLFLKDLFNEFEYLEIGKSKRQIKEYTSISFAKMNQLEFNEYVNNQLGNIYSDLLVPLECEYLYDDICKEFEKFLSKLI